MRLKLPIKLEHRHPITEKKLMMSSTLHINSESIEGFCPTKDEEFPDIECCLIFTRSGQDFIIYLSEEELSILIPLNNSFVYNN